MEHFVEEYRFLHMKKEKKYVSNPRLRGGLFVYELEKELSLEDKIEVIDKFHDGVASYMLYILRKWEHEKNTLSKDNYGFIKKVSKKAWIKKNDPRGIIDVSFKIGKYRLFGTEFKDLSLLCPSTEHGYSMEYTGEEIAHQWFHDFCDSLYFKEKKHFKENDAKELKLTTLKELGQRFSTIFNDLELNDIIYNNKTDVEEKRIDAYILAYKKLEESINSIALALKKDA